MAFPSRRLELLFGAPIDKLTYADFVAREGDVSVAESDDLDYKRLYEKTEHGRAELAKDIAALANATGGVLIIGIAEDNATAAPAKVLGADISDQFVRWVRETAASNIVPLPSFSVHAIQDPDSPAGRGILLVGVPRSPAGPHAVLSSSRPDLAYPRRHGTTTIWMSESSVAAAYRVRFAEATARAERLNDVERDIVESFLDDGQYEPVVVVALVPDVGGDYPIDATSLEEARLERAGANPLMGITQQTLGQVGVASSRFRLEDGLTPPQVRVELHSDGSGAFIAVPWWNYNADDPDREKAVLHSDNFVLQVINGLSILSGHANDRVGLTGTAAVRVSARASVFEHRDFGVHRDSTGFGDGATPVAEYVQLGSFGPNPNRIQPLSERNFSEATGDSVVLVEVVAGRGKGLAESTAIAVRSVFQKFGIVEAPHFTSDGRVRKYRWHRQHEPWIESWANESDVEVTTD